MPDGIVFDIQKFSLHDGPGIRSTVFFKGCGLRCLWCHNPESQLRQRELMVHPNRCIGCGACVEACPQEAIQQTPSGIVTDRARCDGCGACIDVCYAEARTMVGQTMTVDEVLAVVAQDTMFYDESGGGVTFSGGEPLLQSEFLLALLIACKAKGLHTVVDTCGYAPTANFEKIIPYTDLFLYDVKIIDDERHKQFTSVSNSIILRNLRILDAHQQQVVVRIPIIPGINDDSDNMSRISEMVCDLPSVQRIDILPYHHVGSEKYNQLGRANPMPPTEQPAASHMADIKKMLEGFGIQVKVGG